MRLSILLCMLVTIGLVAGCGDHSSRTSSSNSSAKASSSAMASSKAINYQEVEHDGRLYVFGTTEDHASFKQTHHVPYTKTLIGAGPNGQTVVIAINKKDNAYNDALLATYRAKHPFYREIPHDGRLYVVGSENSFKSFLDTGHMPYTRTLIGAGPNSETVVLEIDKKNEALVERLMAQYQARHPFYREITHDGRIYVVGSKESYADFLNAHHLPYCKTYIGKGPNRETVIFELDKKDESLLKRLVEQYNQKYQTKLSI
jgi:hypothetical protein